MKYHVILRYWFVWYDSAPLRVLPMLWEYLCYISWHIASNSFPPVTASIHFPTQPYKQIMILENNLHWHNGSSKLWPWTFLIHVRKCDIDKKIFSLTCSFNPPISNWAFNKSCSHWCQMVRFHKVNMKSFSIVPASVWWNHPALLLYQS